MTTDKTCPRCGEAATGKFCTTCGTALGGAPCPACGQPSAEGARFCTRCGGGLSGSSGPAAGAGGARPTSAGDANMGWWAAGGVLVILILVVAWPVLRPQETAPPPAPPRTGAAAAQGMSSLDLSTMTPRQAADALFDRVMRTAAQGDTAQAMAFLPMAIDAYRMVQPLDPDALFHLSTLHRTGGDFASALAAAQEGLALAPTHLLCLYGAAEASRLMGDEEGAAGYFAGVLENWDAEMGSGNPDYDAHDQQMGTIRSTALAAVGGDE